MVLRWLFVMILAFTHLLNARLTPSGGAADCLLSEKVELRWHPAGSLRVGDVVSLEVFMQSDEALGGRKLAVMNKTKELGQAEIQERGGGQFYAVLQWFWDTRDIQPGEVQLELVVLPDGERWQVNLQLLQAEKAPTAWKLIETNCCRINYLSGSQAERDLTIITQDAERSAEILSQRMGAKLENKLELFIIPRVIGQGGFTTEEVYVSHPERSYLLGSFTQIVEHELVHVIDRQLGGDFRPSLLVEGLAVYLSGGHYQKEPLLAKAAALLDIGWYIPLAKLSNNFYPSQHEIGYLQAGALVEYMVNRWGWEAFNQFYRNIQQNTGGEAQAVDQALRRDFRVSLEQLEDQFLHILETQPENPDLRESVYMTVRLYDTIREYQKKMDPSAYFRGMWIPDGPQMVERGISADYARSPDSLENHQVETLLMEASRNLQAGQYARTGRFIAEARKQLTHIQLQPCPTNEKSPAFGNPHAGLNLAIR